MRLRRFLTIQATLCVALLTLAACGESAGPTDGTTITELTLTGDLAPIGGTFSLSSTTTIDNSGEELTGVTIESRIKQGAVSHTAGTVQVDCGSGEGVLPSGNCEATSLFAAANDSSEIGTLVPGAASLEIRLVDEHASVLGTRSVPVTLVVNAPSIWEVDLAPATFILGGATVEATVRAFNPGTSTTNVSLQGWIFQGTTARRATGGTGLSCGNGAGVLPEGACNMVTSHQASNTGAGTGTLVAGPAYMEVELRVNGTAIYTRTIPVVLQ